MIVWCRYDPDSDTWVRIKSMKQQRIGVGVGVINRLLYAVGGFDGENRLKSVECYNPDRDSWALVADLHECKSGAGNQTRSLCLTHGCGIVYYTSISMLDRVAAGLHAFSVLHTIHLSLPLHSSILGRE